MIKPRKRILVSSVLLAVLASSSLSPILASDAEMDLPREVTINHLGEKGDRMRVFSAPKMAVIRKEAVRADREDRSDARDITPALEITEREDGDAGPVLGILRPFGVEPFTRYRLSWDQKVESIIGGSPEFFIQCGDINFDTIRELTFPIKAARQPAAWEHASVEFDTSPETRNFRLYFRTAKNGAAHLWLDQVWLEQISEREALRPTPVKVAEGIVPEKKPVVFPVPAKRRALSLSAEVKWSQWEGRCGIQFEWLDKEGKVVGKHTCRIASMKGVLPQWKGITADWIGEMQRPTDPLSESRTEHLENAKKGGVASVRYTLAVPDVISAVRLRRIDETVAGSVMVSHVEIWAEP